MPHTQARRILSPTHLLAALLLLLPLRSLLLLLCPIIHTGVLQTIAVERPR
jgi:hypothetical protein